LDSKHELLNDIDKLTSLFELATKYQMQLIQRVVQIELLSQLHKHDISSTDKNVLTLTHIHRMVSVAKATRNNELLQAVKKRLETSKIQV